MEFHLAQPERLSNFYTYFRFYEQIFLSKFHFDMNQNFC